ncbi:MAG: hypothetical protein AB1330_12150 [Bacillota bacterium]
MRKFLAALVILCLLAMLVAPVAYATPIGDSNVSSLDIELQQQKEVEQLLPRDEAIKKFNENKAIADQQKREADQKALEQIIQGAKTLPGSAQKPPVPQSKDIGSVAPAAVVKTWYYWPYTNQSKGGSGIGWSDVYWAASDIIRNGSRAEVYGNYWAKAWGWDYYTPSTTGNYSVTTYFYVTGAIYSGSYLAVRVKVTDTTTGQTITRTIFNPTSGYFDNQWVSATEQFYLYAGRRYAFTFETETNAGAIYSATASDFYTREFDGTQRQIYFWSMSLSV